MEVLNEFGKFMRVRRRELKLSQEKVAELSGLSTRQVTKIENGYVNMKFITLVRLCVACKIDIGELEQFWTSPYDDISYDEIWNISIRT